jgi:predicted dinucleotide-binding enzyme
MSREEPRIVEDGRSPSVFVCGDDPQARNTVAALVRGIGAEPTVAGPLSNARFTEPAGMLLVQLAYRQGMGTSIGLSLLRG